MKSPDRLKIVFCLLCLAPLARLAFLAFTAGLGANPTEKIIHTTGDWALNFLFLTLALALLGSLSGWSWPAKIIKIAGLISFFYAGLHFTAYVVLDQGLFWTAIGDDLLKHKRITVGFASLLLLFPPAVSSISRVKRRLGYERGKVLQSTVYAAAAGGVVHYLWLVKRDTRRPLAYAALLLILLGGRLLAALFQQRRTRRGTR